MRWCSRHISGVTPIIIAIFFRFSKWVKVKFIELRPVRGIILVRLGESKVASVRSKLPEVVAYSESLSYGSAMSC
jgi:hypothetical protein